LVGELEKLKVLTELEAQCHELDFSVPRGGGRFMLSEAGVSGLLMGMDTMAGQATLCGHEETN
jgi:hypothetical protein